MSRVLVTGAGGYIGTTLVPMLLDRGFHVRAVDRYFFGSELLVAHENLEVCQEDSRCLTSEHFNDVDAVIDLVAVSNDPSGEAFEKATWEINHESRVRTANLAKSAGVKRYILPSSCSIYGWQEPHVICSESHDINPLTVYARANRAAEEGVAELSDSDFAVVILRQATIFGYSPRMRFDLAINGMTYGAWKTGKLPLARDGKQYRPMVHVRDAAAAQVFMLEYADVERINGEIFNVGSAACNFQLYPLAEIVAETVPRDVEIEWYGDVDHRSYQASFDKIEALGFKANETAEQSVRDICSQLDGGELDKTDQTITLKWYQELARWREIVRATEMYGGMLDIDPNTPPN